MNPPSRPREKISDQTEEKSVIKIPIEIVLPSTDNDRIAFTAEHDMYFERFLRETIGDFSLLEGIVRGEWKKIPDESRVYLVSLSSITDGGLIRDIVEFARIHYRQHAILIRYLGIIECL